MHMMGAVELTIGLKLAQGREAEVYAWNGNAVLKLYWPGYLRAHRGGVGAVHAATQGKHGPSTHRCG